MSTVPDCRGPLEAWARLSPAGPWLDRAAPVQRKKGKAEVWRLSGPRAVPVIAKRTRNEEARREAYVYREALPRLEIPAPACYGLAPDTDGRHAWLFVEDASGTPYAADDAVHRELASRWLASLHVRGRALNPDDTLEDAGPERYRRQLQELVCLLPGVAVNRALCDQRCVIHRLTAACHHLLECWTSVQAACTDLPPTLVHGSFSRRNMCVRSHATHAALIVFDWGAAGWGPPARDIAKLASPRIAGPLEVYQRHAMPAHAACGPSDVRRVVDLGRLFRAIEHLAWVVPTLQHSSWIEDAMQRLITHGHELAASSERLDLSSPTA